jgi:hypothetical protein
MKYIASIEITLDKEYYDKEMDLEIGFVPSTTTGVMAMIKWSASDIGSLDTAPILTSVSDTSSSLEVDVGMVSDSEFSCVITNHDKALHRFNGLGINLQGQKIKYLVNEFNDSDTLSNTWVLFSGEISSISMSETELTVNCESNPVSMVSTIITEGEVLSAGVTASEFETALLPLIKNEPTKETIDYGATSYLMIGVRTHTTVLGAKIRYYQVYFKVQPMDPMPARDHGADVSNLNHHMYVSSSSAASKGEYRKLTSYMRLGAEWLVGTYASRFPEFASDGTTEIGWYIEFEIDENYSEVLPDDLSTYVQFFKLNHNYSLSKLPITGTIDGLCAKDSNDVYKYIPNFDSVNFWGVKYVLNEDYTVQLISKYPKSDKEILTYTFEPCKNLEIMNYNYPIEYQFATPSNTDIWGQMYALLNLSLVYVTEDSEGSVTDFSWTGKENINSKSMALYAKYTSHVTDDKITLVGFQYDLPEISEDFTFSGAYLGIRLKLKCEKYSTDTPIKIIQSKYSGEAKEVVSISKLKQWDSTYPATYYGKISNIPDYYFSDGELDEWYNGFMESTPALADEQIETFSNYTKFKLDCKTAKEYSDIAKIGIFISRGPRTGQLDEIYIYELCVIFEHLTDVSELYI